MTLLMQAASGPIPTNRNYRIELLYVPPGIQGAPAVGTTWEFRPDEVFTATVPTFWTNDGHEGYRFSLTVGPQCASDMTDDGKVDLSDLATLLSSYGLCDGDPGYIPQADLTGAGDVPDGCVDLPDLAALLADYGCGATP